MYYPRRTNNNTLELWWKGLIIVIFLLHVVVLYNFVSLPPTFIPSVSVNSKPFAQQTIEKEQTELSNEIQLQKLQQQLQLQQQLFEEKEAEIAKFKLQNFDEQVENEKIIQNLLSKQQQIASAIKYQNNLSSKTIKVPTTIRYSHSTYKKNTPEKKLNIVTFNVWNTNEDWKERLIAFAKQIKELEVDIIGFQEVRTIDTGKRSETLSLYQIYQFPSEDKNISRIDGTIFYDESFVKKYPENQLQFIQSLLPDFPYLVFVPFTTFQTTQQEGIAYISKHEIMKAVSINISNGNKGKGYSDTNSRGVLHVSIKIDNPDIFDREFTVDLYNTHLPYVEVQQCNSAIQVFDYINKQPAVSLTVLLGDMNTYFDYEWPMEIFTQKFNWLQLSKINPCSSEISNWLFTHPFFNPEDKIVFKDVWDDEIKRDLQGKMIVGRGESEYDSPGHTFPAFQPSSGVLNNCRPDRMLYFDALTDIVHFERVKVYLFGGEYSPQKFISDHAGILTSFFTS